MTIRQATLNDLTALTELSRSTFAHTYQHLNEPAEFEAYLNQAFSEKQILEELDLANSAFYFVENQQVTIGYFKVNFNKSPAESDRPILNSAFEKYRNAPMTELERIYLKADFQGQGFAAPMMAAVESEARKKGSKCLWLGVWEMNPKAMSYYEKCGFMPIGEHIFQIGTDAQRDWLLAKWLD